MQINIYPDYILFDKYYNIKMKDIKTSAIALLSISLFMGSLLTEAKINTPSTRTSVDMYLRYHPILVADDPTCNSTNFNDSTKENTTNRCLGVTCKRDD